MDGGLAIGYFVASGLSGFPAGAFAGGYINFAAGADWWQQGGWVSGIESSGVVRFTFSYGQSVYGAVDTPSNGDPFFLWGRLVALDAPGEVYTDDLGQDGPAGMLYVWLPGGGSPASHAVEVRAGRMRSSSAAMTWWPWISAVGGGIELDSSSSSVVLDGVALRYGAYALNHTAYLQSALSIQGQGDTFQNGEVDTADGYWRRRRRLRQRRPQFGPAPVPGVLRRRARHPERLLGEHRLHRRGPRRLHGWDGQPLPAQSPLLQRPVRDGSGDHERVRAG